LTKLVNLYKLFIIRILEFFWGLIFSGEKMKSTSVCLIALMAVSLAFSQSCKKKNKELGPESSVMSADAATVVAAAGSPIWVRVESQYQTEPDSTRSPVKDCMAPPTTPNLGPNDASTALSLDCQIDIPEAKLFYSKLYLSFGGDASNGCRIYHFSPYYYKASSSKTFRPRWAGFGVTQVDCRGVDDTGKIIDIPSGCYNGPATTLVPGFPRFDSLWFTSRQQNSGVFEIPSANSKAYNSNRFAANYSGVRPPTQTYPTPGVDEASLGGTDGYILTEWSDYIFSCNDDYDETLFRIRMVIRAVPIATDNPNNFDHGTWEPGHL
jgi:hypothetical protein